MNRGICFPGGRIGVGMGYGTLSPVDSLCLLSSCSPLGSPLPILVSKLRQPIPTKKANALAQNKVTTTNRIDKKTSKGFPQTTFSFLIRRQHERALSVPLLQVSISKIMLAWSSVALGEQSLYSYVFQVFSSSVSHCLIWFMRRMLRVRFLCTRSNFCCYHCGVPWCSCLVSEIFWLGDLHVLNAVHEHDNASVLTPFVGNQNLIAVFVRFPCHYGLYCTKIRFN